MQRKLTQLIVEASEGIAPRLGLQREIYNLRLERRFSNKGDHSFVQGQGNGDEQNDDFFNLTCIDVTYCSYILQSAIS